MSLIDGGDFICYDHDFTTNDVKKWDAHCFKTNHTISGSTACIICGKMTQFENIPFIGTGKIPILKCEDCFK